MPNWCANRLCVRGRSGDIEQVRGLMEGGVLTSSMRTVAEGAQLFLAGCAGILMPTEVVAYPPYPALTAGGVGANTPANRAFTQWLGQLNAGTELTDAICDELHVLWLASGIRFWRWTDLSDTQQACIAALFARQRYDWCGTFASTQVEVWWNEICDGLLCGDSPCFDLRLLLPPRLDVEINGFNGRLLAGVPSGYGWYIERYGTKWPCGHDLTITDGGADWLEVDFDTPWSPPSEAVLVALSARYSVTIDHWYAEQGGDFCGYASYVNGEQTQCVCDALEWSDEGEDDEDAYPEVTGPAWLVDNVAHFGG